MRIVRHFKPFTSTISVPFLGQWCYSTHSELQCEQ